MNEFLAVAVLHLLALIIPGPDFAVILRQSLHFGRRIGMLTALGIGTGISLHLLYSLAGVAALLQASHWLLLSAELLGACWLLYLGVVFIRPQQPPQPLPDDANKPRTNQPARAFVLGFMTNATNPKATLFFLALFTTVVQSTTPFSLRLLYGIWMCAITALWFVLLSLLLTKTSVHHRLLRLSRLIESATGYLLVFFSLRLFWQVASG